MRKSLVPTTRLTSLRIRLGTQNRMYRCSNKGTSQLIESRVLTKVPGFHPGSLNLMIIWYSQRTHPTYHAHNGGRFWVPTVPKEYGFPGQRMSITIEALDEGKFVKGLTPFQMTNDSNLPWLTRSSRIRRFMFDGRHVCIQFLQEPPIEGIREFELAGEVTEPLRFHLGATSLRFSVRDAVGQLRYMAVSHNGHEPPRIGIKYGHEFYPVRFAASDGTRVRLVYRSKLYTFNIATVYVREPSRLYRLGEIQSVAVSQRANQETLEVERIHTVRSLERSMLWHGGTYDAGRIGSEIAYTIGKERLSLERLVLPDPNSAGRDLYTADGRVVIQSRMLTQTSLLSISGLRNLMESQVSRMLKKLQEDFEFNPGARLGYAILSYLDGATIRARIVKSPRQVDRLRESMGKSMG